MPEDREPNAPDMPHADTRTPLHGPTGGVPSDKALSDRWHSYTVHIVRSTFNINMTSDPNNRLGT
eukprot:scaffold8966_cov132-Isochrysis_galbana.AAC.7